MSNKYFYISSENSSDHANFQVDLPNNVRINPYSNLRVLSCRLNVPKNLVIVSNTNNSLYVGVDHWNKKNASIPLLPIQLDPNDYDMSASTSDDNDLAYSLTQKLNNALNPYCFLRGGGDVSLSDEKLTFKVSKMEIYGCPKSALSDRVLEYWLNDPENTSRLRIYHPSGRPRRYLLTQ